MFIYSRLGVNVISLIISCAIFGTSCYVEKQGVEGFQNIKKECSFFAQVAKSEPIKISIGKEESTQENTIEEVTKENTPEEDIKEEKEPVLEDYEWALEIPKISLLAPIQEGTTNSIMEQAIGHFEETASVRGNVGLAAHNRGYSKSYFQNIKELKAGDIIRYKWKNQIKTYEVIQTIIIRDDDWTYLEDTKDNRITLITCVENEKGYRRCVQGIEKNKEGEKNEKS